MNKYNGEYNGSYNTSKYNQRVREAISDLIVGYSKDKQDYLKELLNIQTKLDNKDGTLTYTNYLAYSKEQENLQNKIKELEIKLDCLDLVREICLNIVDEM